MSTGVSLSDVGAGTGLAECDWGLLGRLSTLALAGKAGRRALLALGVMPLVIELAEAVVGVCVSMGLVAGARVVGVMWVQLVGLFPGGGGRGLISRWWRVGYVFANARWVLGQKTETEHSWLGFGRAT